MGVEVEAGWVEKVVERLTVDDPRGFHDPIVQASWDITVDQVDFFGAWRKSHSISLNLQKKPNENPLLNNLTDS